MEKIGNIYQCPKCKEEYNNRPFFWTDRVATKEEAKDKTNKCMSCTSPPEHGFKGVAGKIGYKSVHSYDKELDYYLCISHKKKLKEDIKEFHHPYHVFKKEKE